MEVWDVKKKKRINANKLAWSPREDEDEEEEEGRQREWEPESRGREEIRRKLWCKGFERNLSHRYYLLCN